MSLKTIEQIRADFAYNKIAEVNGWQDSKKKSDYRSYVRGFASMILQNGFGQALAFLRSKGKEDLTDPHNILYKHINEWLSKGDNDFDILEKIRTENSDKYRQYTKETLALLVWLRKFAEAELPEKK